jgi:hypothetical protein
MAMSACLTPLGRVILGRPTFEAMHAGARSPRKATVFDRPDLEESSVVARQAAETGAAVAMHGNRAGSLRIEENTGPGVTRADRDVENRFDRS